MENLSYEAVCKLSLLLDPPDRFGNDWRMVACELGLSQVEINNLERDESPTRSVLNIYQKRSAKNGREILVKLAQVASNMDREDVLKQVALSLDKMRSRQQQFKSSTSGCSSCGGTPTPISENDLNRRAAQYKSASTESIECNNCRRSNICGNHMQSIDSQYSTDDNNDSLLSTPLPDSVFQTPEPISSMEMSFPKNTPSDPLYNINKYLEADNTGSLSMPGTKDGVSSGQNSRCNTPIGVPLNKQVLQRQTNVMDQSNASSTDNLSVCSKTSTPIENKFYHSVHPEKLCQSANAPRTFENDNTKEGRSVDKEVSINMSGDNRDKLSMAKINAGYDTGVFATTESANIQMDKATDAILFYGRLCCCVLTEGQSQISQYLLHNVPKDLTFDEFISHHRPSFLKLLKKQKITQEQYDQIFPENESANPEDYSLSLLYVIITTVIQTPGIDWHRTPGIHDRKPAHYVMRLKGFVDKLYKMSRELRIEMSSAEFDKLFQDISNILEALGADPDSLRKYIDDPLDNDPDANQAYSLAIEKMCEQFKSERGNSVHEYINRRLKKFIWAAGIVLTCVIILVIITIIMVNFQKKEEQLAPCESNIKDVINKDSGVFRYLTRDGWSARQFKAGRGNLKTPVNHIIIAHTAGWYCTDTDICCDSVKRIQNNHMDTRHWSDIGYNFLIGGDGVVFEGRGWEIEGAHSYGWNAQSIGIAFLGDFRIQRTTAVALTALKELLRFGVRRGFIGRDYVLWGQCQVRPWYSPGKFLLDEIKKLGHWKERTVSLADMPLKVRAKYCGLAPLPAGTNGTSVG